MHLPQSFTLPLSISLSISLAAGLSTGAAGTKACAAQNILTNCLSVQGLQFSACAYSDWACKCQAQKSVVMCYNNCPGDDARAAQEGQVTVFCNAAMREEEQKSLVQSKSSKSAGASATQTKQADLDQDQDQDQDQEGESAAADSRRIKSPSPQGNKRAGGGGKKNAASAAGKGLADAQENGAASSQLPSMAALAAGAALWTLFV